MTITFTISAAKIARISAMLDSYGYVFDPTTGVTDNNQRMAFFRKVTVDLWTNAVFTYERSLAIALDASHTDSAALQAKRFVNFADITATWT